MSSLFSSRRAPPPAHPTRRPPVRVAIIGGGPSGLSAAKTLLDGAERWAPVDIHDFGIDGGRAKDGGPSFEVEVSLFEREEEIGGTFRYRGYPTATLVSSKQLTCFSDFRMPLDHKDHLALPEYVDYLKAYAEHFKLREKCKRFKLGTEVLGIRRAKENEDGNHIVTWRDMQSRQEESDCFDALMVCSGLHVVPNWPEIPGMPPLLKGDIHQKDIDEAHRNRELSPASSSRSSSSGEQPEAKKESKQGKISSEQLIDAVNLSPSQSRILALHSSQFKDPAIFENKRVLIMGTGETGMDLGYLAVKNKATEIVMCTRGGFLSFPAVLQDFKVMFWTFDGKLPIDGLISNLFETAYVSNWVASSRLRWHFSDRVLKRVLWVLTGTTAGCSQWVGELPPERLGRAYVFLNKSAKAMPYLNRPYKKRHWLAEAFAKYLDPPDYSEDETHIDLAPFPHHLNTDGSVIFNRNSRKESKRMEEQTRLKPFKPDVVVFATGYEQTFPMFRDEDNYPLPQDAGVRNIFARRDPTVAYLGFVRPGVGAVPSLSEQSSQFYTLVLASRMAPPTSAPHYHLLASPTARIQYGVDHSAYVSQLARDMKTDPGLWELWRDHGAFVLFVYCMAAAFTPFYRLCGVWKSDTAAEIAKTELWDTVKRRGVAGNLMMSWIPILFYGPVNLVALVLETLYNSLSAKRADTTKSEEGYVDVRKRRQAAI